ncbi:hypothetical protein [uncultured Azohydromonas sp.]|uniref:hypothetical protein n=1 Tax=uncultured Azohydromonas sp. TaxID=487342 RepID=UPI00262C240F|nr:hypothetical protein [uncultured Azohydromonas sp.]
MSELLDALQWPAMAATLVASWMVASQRKRKRNWGFWVFILSNVLWLAWGWHTKAWALMALQLGLFVLNLRAARKNDPERDARQDGVPARGAAARNAPAGAQPASPR